MRQGKHQSRVWVIVLLWSDPWTCQAAPVQSHCLSFEMLTYDFNMAAAPKWEQWLHIIRLHLSYCFHQASFVSSMLRMLRQWRSKLRQNEGCQLPFVAHCWCEKMHRGVNCNRIGLSNIYNITNDRHILFCTHGCVVTLRLQIWTRIRLACIQI